MLVPSLGSVDFGLAGEWETLECRRASPGPRPHVILGVFSAGFVSGFASTTASRAIVFGIIFLTLLMHISALYHVVTTTDLNTCKCINGLDIELECIIIFPIL